MAEVSMTMPDFNLSAMAGKDVMADVMELNDASILRAADIAADKMQEEVKEGYADSSAYNIEPRAKDGAPALYETGKLMNNVARTPVKLKELPNGDREVSFKVYMKNGGTYPSGKNTADIAEYHESKAKRIPKRPLWAQVKERHQERILNELINDIN